MQDYSASLSSSTVPNNQQYAAGKSHKTSIGTVSTGSFTELATPANASSRITIPHAFPCSLMWRYDSLYSQMICALLELPKLRFHRKSVITLHLFNPAFAIITICIHIAHSN